MRKPADGQSKNSVPVLNPQCQSMAFILDHSILAQEAGKGQAKLLREQKKNLK